jgi:hypothetical protein
LVEQMPKCQRAESASCTAKELTPGSSRQNMRVLVVRHWNPPKYF